ncbi:MAG: hypothetical protein WBK91_06570 [Alphaproteobacteria bacterium]
MNLPMRISVTSAKKISLIALALAALTPGAQASNKVSSPDITQGQFELEYRGGYDIDNVAQKDGQQVHRFVGNYGVLDRWRTEVKGILTEAGEGYDWTAIEWSHRFQLLKGKDEWPKLSVQGNYKFALQDNKTDKIEFTILASKDMGSFGHVINLNFEREVGAHSVGGTNFNLGWKSKYRYRSEFEPGFEFYADFRKFGGPATKGSKRHLLGPVAYGKIIDGMKYEAGFLAGISDGAPDGRFKWILTYAF